MVTSESETTPLLGSGLPWSLPIAAPDITLPMQPARTHFLDNLRAVLTLLVIFHHAALNVFLRTAFDDPSMPERRARASLLAFTQANTQSLWPMFFCVSGWAARLAMAPEKKVSGYSFVKKRVVWTLLPAAIYLTFVRRVISRWMLGWDTEVFDSPNPLWTSNAQLTGPSPYIFALVALDIGHVVVRWLASKAPSPIPNNLEVVMKITFIMNAILLVVHASFLTEIHARLIPAVYYAFFPGDEPGYGAPTTFIVAYAAGANGPFLQRQLLTGRWIIAALAAVASLTFAYYPAPFIGAFRNVSILLPGYNTAYYAIVFFSIPWSLLSLFNTIPILKRKWSSSWVRWSWLVAYVHVIPMVVGIYLMQTPDYFVENLCLRAVLAGTAGGAITWALVAIIAKVWKWTKWIRRGGRLSMILIRRRL